MMYDRPHKVNVGGSRGGVSKRNSLPPPHRLLSHTASGRLSEGRSARQGRNPSPFPAIPLPYTAANESFNLVSGEPLSFAAIICLVPDLVEEIKRVEAIGGAARIKFDPKPNNPLGNVIDVGGKEFRFKSHEIGHPCDIYEERWSDEDGNGLLVESGCAWHKLNPECVLDESTRNHVKRRAEEVDCYQKSKKYVLLSLRKMITEHIMLQKKTVDLLQTQVFLGKSLAYMGEPAPANANFEEEQNLVGKDDASLCISYQFGGDDLADNSEEQAANSSDSESDSDSGNGDSSSDSGSRSQSLEGTARGSGSNSKNDSFSDHEGSDVDVNIVDDDDKEPNNPLPWSLLETRPVEVGDLENQDGYTSEDVDIEKDLDCNEVQLAIASRDRTVSTASLKTGLPDHHHEDIVGKFKHEHPDGSNISKGKYKRGSHMVQSQDYVESVKRLKTGSAMTDFVGSGPFRSSLDITNKDFHENHLQIQDKLVKNNNSGVNRVYDYLPPGKSDAELLQSAKRLIRDQGTDKADKSAKTTQNLGQDVKHQEANSHGDKGYNGTPEEVSRLSKKVNAKFKEGGLDKKQLGFPDRNHNKCSEEGKRSNRMENSSRLPPKDRFQRELSDLEPRELYGPLTEEPRMVGKKFEREGSFKHSCNADLNGTNGGKQAITMVDESPLNLTKGITMISDGQPKKKSPESITGRTVRSDDTAVKSQKQLFGGTCLEVGSLSNKTVDLSKPRHGDSVQGTDFEGCRETQKNSQSGVQLEESRQHFGSWKVKGNKSRKSSALEDATGRRKDVSTIDGCKDKRKRNGSSSNEYSLYSKYEQENAELKGHIKNFSEYKKYVQEFRGKYDCYCSLHKNLEIYRNDFQKLGIDLESAKGRDMEKYYSIVAQLKESYQQCEMRYTRLKKTFLVLHEELKHLKQMIKDFAVEYMRECHEAQFSRGGKFYWKQ